MVDNFCEVVDTCMKWSIPPAHTILMAIKITCAWPGIDFPFTLCYSYPNKERSRNRTRGGINDPFFEAES